MLTIFYIYLQVRILSTSAAKLLRMMNSTATPALFNSNPLLARDKLSPMEPARVWRRMSAKTPLAPLIGMSLSLSWRRALSRLISVRLNCAPRVARTLSSSWTASSIMPVAVCKWWIDSIIWIALEAMNLMMTVIWGSWEANKLAVNRIESQWTWKMQCLKNRSSSKSSR